MKKDFEVRISAKIIDKLLKLGKGMLETYILLLRYIDRRKNKNSRMVTFSSSFLAWKMGVKRGTLLARLKVLYEVGLIEWFYMPTVNGRWKTNFFVSTDVDYAGELTAIRSWEDRCPVDNFTSQSSVQKTDTNNIKGLLNHNNDNVTKAEKLVIHKKIKQRLAYLYRLQEQRVAAGKCRYGWRGKVVNMN